MFHLVLNMIHAIQKRDIVTMIKKKQDVDANMVMCIKIRTILTVLVLSMITHVKMHVVVMQIVAYYLERLNHFAIARMVMLKVCFLFTNYIN